ncbi:MAG: hypothetical protein AVDCRST_MAG85-3966, partial [uncultured Solirubrobacteraceae bacterium]
AARRLPQAREGPAARGRGPPPARADGPPQRRRRCQPRLRRRRHPRPREARRPGLPRAPDDLGQQHRDRARHVALHAHDRPPHAPAPPRVRHVAAADDRPAPALGDRPREAPTRLAPVLQERLGLGQRRSRPPGRAADRRRAPDLGGGHDERQRLTCRGESHAARDRQAPASRPAARSRI